jgi:hypothetical protein
MEVSMSSFFAALTGNIAVKLLIESLMAIFARIGWSLVVERFLMRVIKIALRSLAARTTNTVDDGLVEDIIASLEKRDLPKV